MRQAWAVSSAARCAAWTAALLGACARAQEPVAERIGDRMVRFSASGAPAKAPEPSMALLSAAAGGGGAPEGLGVRPRWVSLDGDLSWTIDVPAGTSLYGTGEGTGPLLRNGRSVVMWNTDAYGYADPPPPASLYESYPWVLAVRPDGTAFGVLADTTYRTRIDLSHGIGFKAEGTWYPLVVIER